VVKLAFQPTASVFWATVKPSDPAIPLPKFNVVAVDELLCGLNRRVVVAAIKLDGPNKMAVIANNTKSH
jgi:hypothetical protein